MWQPLYRYIKYNGEQPGEPPLIGHTAQAQPLAPSPPWILDTLPPPPGVWSSAGIVSGISGSGPSILFTSAPPFLKLLAWSKLVSFGSIISVNPFPVISKFPLYKFELLKVVPVAKS